MTKAQIIERVSEQVTTLTKRQAEVVVNTIFDCIRDSLRNGNKTEIRGFGSFRLRARRMKEGRNPKTGATVAVPAKRRLASPRPSPLFRLEAHPFVPLNGYVGDTAPGFIFGSGEVSAIFPCSRGAPDATQNSVHR